MHLTQLRLKDFRSYQQISIAPPPGVTVIVGENGTGKTNLLEAIHLCCLGKSHRTNEEKDMIRLGQDTCAVYAKVERSVGTDEVGVRLYAKSRTNKTVYVNGKTVQRIGELMGHMNCVMFSPEDLDIIKGGPMQRRRYMDMLLSQSRPQYFYALQAYHVALKQRNATLRAVIKGERFAALDIWDEQLAKYAAPIIVQRRKMLAALAGYATEHYRFIAQREEETLNLTLDTLPEEENIETYMHQALIQNRQEDLRRLSTGVGPHRDDLVIDLKKRGIKSHASQGQMRTAVLALRLAEMDYMTRLRGDAPILLLDDVLSELDENRRTRLIEKIKSQQTIITCTDEKELRGAKVDCLLRVEAGNIHAL